MGNTRKEKFVEGIKTQIERIEESRKFLDNLINKMDETNATVVDDINKAAYALAVFNLISAEFAVEFHYRVIDKLEDGKIDEIFTNNVKDFEDFIKKMKDPGMMN